MTQIEYILDERFEALGCSFQWEGRDPFWVDGPDLPVFFTRIDWSRVPAISPNAAFDMLILALRYGIYPKMYGCTLSMARNWLGNKLRHVRLDDCGQYFGYPKKRDTTQRTKGQSFAAIKANPTLYAGLVTYCME